MAKGKRPKAEGASSTSIYVGSLVIDFRDGIVEYRQLRDGRIWNETLHEIMNVPEGTTLQTIAERAMRTSEDYRVYLYSAEETEQRDRERAEERWNRPDYELGYGLGPGGSISMGARRTARRNRINTRIQRRGGR